MPGAYISQGDVSTGYFACGMLKRVQHDRSLRVILATVIPMYIGISQDK